MNHPFGNKIQSLLSNDRIANLIKYSNVCSGLGGYIAEFGVYQGGSLEVLARFNPGIDIIGVDSFEGLPEVSDKDYHQQGDFGGVDVRKIIGYFGMVYPSVRIVKGFIPKVFEFFDEHTRFSFSHVDLDIYEAIRHTLDFLIPRTLTGGMILLDDYKVRSTPGCEKAIDDFFNEHPIEVKFKGELLYHENGKTHNQYLIAL